MPPSACPRVMATPANCTGCVEAAVFVLQIALNSPRASSLPLESPAEHVLFFLVNDFLLAMEKGQVSTPILFDLSAAFSSSGNDGVMICSVWHGWAVHPCRSIPPFQRDSTAWLGAAKHFPPGLFQGAIQCSAVLLLTEGWGYNITDVLMARDRINLQVNNPRFSKYIIHKHLLLPSACSIVAWCRNKLRHFAPFPPQR